MDRVQEYEPGNPIRNALWIIEDIMKEGVSQGWVENRKEALATAGVLEPFGVYFVGGLLGEWRSKNLSKIPEDIKDEILMDLCQEMGIEGIWRDVSGFKKMMADYLEDEIEEEYEERIKK